MGKCNIKKHNNMWVKTCVIKKKMLYGLIIDNVFIYFCFKLSGNLKMMHAIMYLRLKGWVCNF